MTRMLALATVMAASAAAQLQLYTAPPGGAEQAVTGIQDLGRAYAGDSLSARLRIRNHGAASVSLTVLHVSGSGFTMTGAPSLPHIVAPGTNVDFTIHFRPPDEGSFSANVQVNGTGYLMRATGIASASLFLEGLPVATGSTVDFGRIERGGQRVLTFEARNTTREAVTIRTVEIGGGAFSLTDMPALPAEVLPGGALSFGVRFAPSSNQIHTGRLTVDALRVIQLTGTGLEPPLPRPVLAIETPAIRSGEQGRVTVRLAETSRAHGKGQLRMELKPASQVRDNDASAQLLAGGRSASFTIAEGASMVAFDKSGSAEMLFQAGTTAGTIEFIVEAGGYTERMTVTVAAEPVRIDRAAATRAGSSIELQIAGFDNSRSAGDMTFTFFGSGGQTLPAVRVNASTDFARWWESSTLGGTFSLRATFPVTGDASQIRAVEVEMRNASGTARTDRLSF